MENGWIPRSHLEKVLLDKHEIEANYIKLLNFWRFY